MKKNNLNINTQKNDRISDEELFKQIKSKSYNLLSDDDIQIVFNILKNTMDEIDRNDELKKNKCCNINETSEISIKN